MSKKEIIDLLYKVIAYINGDDVKPTDRICADRYYYVEPTKESGYCRSYIHITEKSPCTNSWICSIITINGEAVYLSDNVESNPDWLLGLFGNASILEQISEVKFRDKWNEASEIIKKIKEL